MIEVQNVFQHLFCFYSRRVRIECNGFHIAVEGMLPVALPSILIALSVPFLCRH